MSLASALFGRLVQMVDVVVMAERQGVCQDLSCQRCRVEVETVKMLVKVELVVEVVVLVVVLVVVQAVPVEDLCCLQFRLKPISGSMPPENTNYLW